MKEERTCQYLLSTLDRLNGGSYSESYLRRLRALATDTRLDEFWKWFQEISPKARHWVNAYNIATTIIRFTALPSKPGNMTPAQRERYFQKVRTHTEALLALLNETYFDVDTEDELDDHQLDRSLNAELWSWGEDEPIDGHIVAFRVTDEAVYRQHYRYPENRLTSLLSGVLEWTHWPDEWDGNFLKSSAPIVQAKSDSANCVFFTCSLYDYFQQAGESLPFNLLATVANVALNLPADRLLDEDSARKQVRRYQARRASVPRGEDAF
jgi:hypothetical protein